MSSSKKEFDRTTEIVWAFLFIGLTGIAFHVWPHIKIPIINIVMPSMLFVLLFGALRLRPLEAFFMSATFILFGIYASAKSMPFNMLMGELNGANGYYAGYYLSLPIACIVTSWIGCGNASVRQFLAPIAGLIAANAGWLTAVLLTTSLTLPDIVGYKYAIENGFSVFGQLSASLLASVVAYIRQKSVDENAEAERKHEAEIRRQQRERARAEAREREEEERRERQRKEEEREREEQRRLEAKQRQKEERARQKAAEEKRRKDEARKAEEEQTRRAEREAQARKDAEVESRQQQASMSDSFRNQAPASNATFDDTFDSAVEKKRQGDYEGAIRAYRQCLDQFYADDTQSREVLKAMGKVFYLQGAYPMALACYETFILLFLTPQAIKDYYAMGGDDYLEHMDAQVRFVGAFQDICRHLGHCLNDSSRPQGDKYVADYRNAISGKHYELYQDYEKQCMHVGIDHLCNMMNQIHSMKDVDRLLPNYVRIVMTIDGDKVKNAMADKGRRASQEFHTKAVGVTFNNAQSYIPQLKTGEKLHIERETNNPHDPNAIAIYDKSHHLIGHFSRNVAAELAPKLDAGSHAVVKVSAVTGGGEHNYGVNLHVTVY